MPNDNDNAVVVFTVKPPDLQYVAKFLQDALRTAYDDGVHDRQLVGPVYMGVEEPAEMVLDVFREPESGGGRHELAVDNERWHLQHSLRCRRAGLENCPLTTLAGIAVEQGHVGIGRHEVRLDEAGVLLWGDDL